MSVILGVDPGSRFTGYGLICVEKTRLRHISHGVIAIPGSLSFSQRLNFLSQNLSEIFQTHAPHITVVEKVFLGKNPDSAFKLGHVRGVCLQGAAQAKSEVVEYAARKVKKVVTGSGNASKDQVSLIIQNLLGIASPQQLDASDALALAVCHSRQLEVQRLMTAQMQQLEPL